MSRFFYTALLRLGSPLIALYLLWRARRQPEYRRHWAERWGLAFPDLPDDRPLLWLHAVSVGETRAAEPLLLALRQACPEARLLVTHMTPTGRAVPLPLDGVVRCYLPYDYPGAMRRFLRHYRPAVGLLLETEVWPNLVAAARAADVPLALVNGRLSERSLRRGRYYRALIGPAVAGLTTVIAQTEADAARLATLGAAFTVVAGNLKFDMALKPEAQALARQMRTWFTGRPVLLLASTREGEEGLLLDALRLAQGLPPDLLVVLVPRHPQRFDEVARLVALRGLVLERRSGLRSGMTVAAATQLLLGDSMGEMAGYYGAADLAYVGGSLVPLGGQNLIEACLCGCPVLIGPHTFNFAQASADALAAGAALRVADAPELMTEAARLLANAADRMAMTQAGLAFAQAHSGATQRTLGALEPLLSGVRAAR